MCRLFNCSVKQVLFSTTVYEKSVRCSVSANNCFSKHEKKKSVRCSVSANNCFSKHEKKKSVRCSVTANNCFSKHEEKIILKSHKLKGVVSVEILLFDVKSLVSTPKQHPMMGSIFCANFC